jgi:hypothetical protein
VGQRRGFCKIETNLGFTLTLARAISTIRRFSAVPKSACPIVALPAAECSMRKVLKIAAIVSAVMLVVAGVALVSLYEASQRVPAFYSDALAIDLGDQHEARDEFIAQATALASDLHRLGRWQRLFTADQINAWLALELATNYPGLLPDGLHDPRVMIGDKEAAIACRYQKGSISAVLSLSVDAYLQEPNVVALRIRRARAGALPVPLTRVLDGISQVARELKLRLEWRKTHGDPVALITFPHPRDSRSEALKLQTVELRDDELFLAGGAPPGRDTAGLADAQPPNREEESNDTQPVVGSAPKETRQE